MLKRVGWVLSAVASLAVSSVQAHAQERPTLSGAWTASALSETWSIGDWGEACGPKPAPRGAGGGMVQVSEGGGELAFSGGGYPRTSGCFEMGGGISVQSHSASPRGWRTRCGTPANDPRRATIVTTLTATDTTIVFDETGQYQFVLKEQNCTASVRRSRTYTLVKRLGDEPKPEPSAAPPPTAEVAKPAPTPEAPRPAPTPTAAEAERPSCDNPGEPARLEVRPSRKVMKPGETFTARAVLLDASGCKVPGQPSWQGPGGPVTVAAGGRISVAADAPEGEYAVSVGVGGKSVKIVVEVASPERYASLLAGGTVNAAGENDEAAVAVVATSSLGASSAVAEDTAKKRRLVFLGGVGAVVLVLAGFGVVLLRRSRHGGFEEVEEEVPGETKMTVVKKKRVVARARAVSGGMVCPTCKRGYPPGAVFCPQDGSKLESATQAQAVIVAPAPQPVGAQQVKCPACGTAYAAGTRFCGKDGTVLNPG